MKEYIIADNQAITQLGLFQLLSSEKSASTILTADNQAELTKILKSYPKAIVILDYTLFDFKSIDELLQLQERFNETHWLLFSGELNTNILRRLIPPSNAFSVIMKSCSKEEILTAISYISKGERFICNQVSNLLLAASTHQAVVNTMVSQPHALLTSSEISILKEIALGKTTKEIAASKNLSFHTVNSHRKNIFRKLEANSVHEAIKQAMRLGLIDLTEYYI